MQNGINELNQLPAALLHHLALPRADGIPEAVSNMEDKENK